MSLANTNHQLKDNKTSREFDGKQIHVTIFAEDKSPTKNGSNEIAL
jgi:hypothetical protein